MIEYKPSIDMQLFDVLKREMFIALHVSIQRDIMQSILSLVLSRYHDIHDIRTIYSEYSNLNSFFLYY